MSIKISELVAASPLGIVTGKTSFECEKDGVSYGCEADDIADFFVNDRGALLSSQLGVSVQAYDSELAAIAAVTSATNKMIQFTGAQSATTKDFVDNASFTPTLTRYSSAPTIDSYTVRSGSYCKIGGLVVVNMAIVVNGDNISAAGSGPNIISGLPYACSVDYSPGIVGYNDVLSATGAKSVSMVGTNLFFNGIGPTQSNISENYNGVSGNHYLGIAIQYLTNA